MRVDLAEGHETVEHHPPARVVDQPGRGPVHALRPDVVVSDQRPAAQRVVRGQPGDRQAQLVNRVGADADDPGSAGAALVRRREDVRRATRDGGLDGTVHVAGVKPNQGVDGIGGTEPVDLGCDLQRGASTVDEDQVDVRTADTAGDVQLVGGEQARVHCGRPDHAERARLRNHQADPQTTGTARQELGLQRVGQPGLDPHGTSMLLATAAGREATMGQRTSPGMPSLVETLILAQRRAVQWPGGPARRRRLHPGPVARPAGARRRRRSPHG